MTENTSESVASIIAAADATERDMLDLLSMKFFGDRYVFAEHVNNGAGFSFGRTLDAIVFDTWPSEGLYLHGFEVKVSSADFRRELQNTAKSAAFTGYLDSFSIVAPAGVVDKALLPAKWGLYLPDGKGSLRAVRKPLMLHEDGTRDGVDRSLMAAFCRALMTRGAVGKEFERRMAIERTSIEFKTSQRLQEAESKAESLETAIKEFEEHSGIKINRYEGAGLGDAVRMVRKARSSSEDWRIQAVRGHAKGVLEAVDKLAETLAALREETP